MGVWGGANRRLTQWGPGEKILEGRLEVRRSKTVQGPEKLGSSKATQRKGGRRKDLHLRDRTRVDVRKKAPHRGLVKKQNVPGKKAIGAAPSPRRMKNPGR